MLQTTETWTYMDYYWKNNKTIEQYIITIISILVQDGAPQFQVAL